MNNIQQMADAVRASVQQGRTSTTIRLMDISAIWEYEIYYIFLRFTVHQGYYQAMFTVARIFSETSEVILNPVMFFKYSADIKTSNTKYFIVVKKEPTCKVM